MNKCGRLYFGESEVYESKFDKCCPIAEVHIRDEDVQVQNKEEDLGNMDLNLFSMPTALAIFPSSN